MSDKQATRILKMISGALRANCSAHGNVVEGSWIGSANKRILGQLKAAGVLKEDDDVAC